MKFTLAILPAFFALSAFGNPVKLDTRQMLMCDVAKCISTIATQPNAIFAPCADAIGNLAKIQQAQAQGMPPSQADQFNLVSNTIKCISASIAARFVIPANCNSCIGGPPGSAPAPGFPT
ncbi:hypothetical protein AGABI2DRAFT_196196 [Agaricus bisporus var. bisporus H97]|uniref:hypothetical protein n=1 Tax=Agaricus bisporus var. bisporus (strain H97 / ATCC MYA-4626 / FGSC 10389) TaxID=936046 RepID=UPI00029F56FB|nr:hypothetical protein AGABI2DRAFT_196196 [Agaricus bisporus var. bisporus H97]EKV41688.1 hypothetical protein AGABI2DRAFT_196196 [Agaricus bisporus var. bisporus H97]